MHAARLSRSRAACGDDRRRDRPAEFASRGDDGSALAAEIESASAEISRALQALDPARLDVRLVPPQDLFGEGPTHEISVRDAIIQVIEHASHHLGHLDMLVDLMGSGAPRPVYGAVTERPFEQEIAVDTEPARARLGWAATTGLEQGLRQTLAWYADHGQALRP